MREEKSRKLKIHNARGPEEYKKPDPIDKKKAKERKCLKCDKRIISPWPGLCKQCKELNQQYDIMAEWGVEELVIPGA